MTYHPSTEPTNNTRVVCDGTGLGSISKFLTNEFIRIWTEKSAFYQTQLESRVVQQVGPNLTITYPENPTCSNTVRVSAICEPCKVRTVTVGDSQNWVLKPLQKAMFESLRGFECFAPCFGPEFSLDLIQGPGLFLSGDYTSATDCIHPSFLHVYVEELIKHIGEDHPLVPHILRESSPHLVQYPKLYKLPDVYQTSGQLMGSLLSFPVLCLVNAFTIGDTLTTVPGYIHGDDILAKVNVTKLRKWKKLAPQCGLSLSIGKNYVSRDWGSIDSRIIFRDGSQPIIGKFGSFKSTGPAVTNLLRRGIPKGLIVSECKEQLSKIPNSLDVSTTYGGLNPEPNLHPITDLDRAIYAMKISGENRIQKIRDSHYLVIRKEQGEALLSVFKKTVLPVEVDCEERDTVSDFTRLREFTRKGKLSFHPIIIDKDFSNDYIVFDCTSNVAFARNYLASLKGREILTNRDLLYFEALGALKNN